jgi:hypothetical protein
LVQAERAQAEAAVQLLERWVEGIATGSTDESLWISQVAGLLDVTPDMFRNWERNGLLKVPRESVNGFWLHGAAEIRPLRAIRMLSGAGYSQMAILRIMLHLD